MEKQCSQSNSTGQHTGCSIEKRLKRNARTCFRQVPISSDTKYSGVNQVYLSGFESSHNLNVLETKLKELCFSVLTKKERTDYFKEQRQLTEFRKKTLKMTLIGEVPEDLKKPETPVTNKLDFLLYQFEVEITKKVIQNMSTLTKRVLEVEFQLQETNKQKNSLIPQNDFDESQLINSFYEKLRFATECAISEKKQGHNFH